MRNQKLFFHVEAVVYLEGGRGGLSLQSVLNGSYNTSAPDVGFWRGIFSTFYPKRKCHFKPVGSKSVLKVLSQEILDGSIKNTFICRDRDYDHMRSDFSHSFVISSRGYSWENDVLLPKIIVESIGNLTGTIDRDGALLKKVDLELQKFHHETRWLVRREIALHSRDIASGLRHLIPQLVAVSKSGKPVFHPNRYVKHLCDSKSNRIQTEPAYTYGQIDHYDCNGHLVAQFVFHLYRQIVHDLLSIKIPLVVVEGLLAQMSPKALKIDKSIRQHYQHQLSQFEWTSQ